MSESVPRAHGAARPRDLKPRSRGEIAHADSRVRRTLGLSDLLSVSIALGAVALLTGRDIVWAGAACWALLAIASMKVLGLYDRDPQLLHKSTLDELPRLLAVAIAAGFTALAAETLIVEPRLEGATGVLLVALLAGLVPVTRAVSRKLARRTLPSERCLLVGSSAQAASLEAALRATPGVRATLVGVMNRREESGDRRAAAERGLAATAERIVTTAQATQADRVILSAELADVEELLATIRRFNQDGLKVSLAPGPGHVMHAAAELDRLGGTALLGVYGFELTWSSRALKRGLDLVVAVAALVLLAPVMVVIAIAIKLDSPGPVLFRQLRAGRGGDTFSMLKFRSMSVDAEAQHEALAAKLGRDVLFKMDDDPRITRVGRVVRRWSMDELPQLLNVLKGEMSLVGPRPLPVAEDQRIGVWARERLADVKPGVTGPWQVLVGVDRVPLADMIRLDVQYVSRWSLWTDLRVLLLTTAHVFLGRGH